jgi:hypothetical protein
MFFFRHMTNEMKCMMLAGGVFVLFFSGAMVNAARADIQWDDSYSDSYQMVYDQSVDLDNTGDQLMAKPDDGPQAGGPDGTNPEVGGPNDPPPAPPANFLQIIARFIDAMILSVNFWGVP